MNYLQKTTLTLFFTFGSYISFSQQIGTGYESWITDWTSPLLSGAYSSENSYGGITGDLKAIDGSHPWNHLFTIRHQNAANNHQLQIASTYAENDRLFFRKFAQTGAAPATATWFELATRKANTFVGLQTISDPTGTQLRLSNTSALFNDIKTDASGYLTIMPNNATTSRIGFNIATPLTGFHSNMGAFRVSDPASSTRAFQVSPNYAGNGDIPAGVLLLSAINSANEGTSLIPTGGGFPGVKLGAYAFNGRSWKSIWETANATFTTPNLLLVKNGGNVGIGMGAVAPRSKLDVNGKVIIGTTMQTGMHGDAMLAVDGKIVAKSCYITMTGWADYVFANDYKVPNLYEVEAYYKANKHLPEIPSEKEIIENGIDVADMNKLLLKKIEEMTILMVQQQKDIDALKKQNNK